MLWPEKGARRTVGRRAQMFRQRRPRVTCGKRTELGRLRRSTPKQDERQRRYPISVWVTVEWAWASYQPTVPISLSSAPERFGIQWSECDGWRDDGQRSHREGDGQFDPIRRPRDLWRQGLCQRQEGRVGQGRRRAVSCENQRQSRAAI